MEIQYTADQAVKPALPNASFAPRDVAAAAPERSTRIVQQPSPTQALPSAEELRKAVDEVQNVISSLAKDLRFSVDDDTGRTVVKVIDIKTDTVLRQFPSEEILSIAKALDKFQGLLVHQKA